MATRTFQNVTGVWSTTTDWNPVGTPIASDAIVFTSGYTGTSTVDSAYTVTSVTTLATAMILDVRSTLTLTGTLTQGLGSTIQVGLGGVLNLDGNYNGVTGARKLTNDASGGGTVNFLTLRTGLQFSATGITVHLNAGATTGRFEVVDGTLTLTGSGDTSTFNMDGATVDLTNATTLNDAKFDFIDETGIQPDLLIVKHSTLGGANTFTNFGPSDAIRFTDLTFTAGSTASVNTATHVLTVKNSTGLITELTLSGFTLDTGAQNTFIVTSNEIQEVSCFAAGTRIQTIDGEVAVEQLRSGDLVRIVQRDAPAWLPVTWIGRRRIDLARHPGPERVAPIRVLRNAFADQIPARDILLSPDHAVYVDGRLIAIRQLVNGTSIVQMEGLQSVDYFHVELESHAVLLAEGLPAETYLDTGNRAAFTNSGVPPMLHPYFARDEADCRRQAASCAPFVTDETMVLPVWQVLAKRAVELGFAPWAPATTDEPEIRLLADGRELRAVTQDANRYVFVLPHQAGAVRLVSRSVAPAETRPWLNDRRRLGVSVQRITLHEATGLSEIPLDHPSLSDGWWAPERDGQVIRRWTDGSALISLPSREGAVAMLEVCVSDSLDYPSASGDGPIAQSMSAARLNRVGVPFSEIGKRAQALDNELAATGHLVGNQVTCADMNIPPMLSPAPSIRPARRSSTNTRISWRPSPN